MRLGIKEREIVAEQKAEQLRYIASLIRELRDMAQARRDQMLTYLLEMAYLEASDRLRGVPDVEVNDKRHAA